MDTILAKALVNNALSEAATPNEPFKDRRTTAYNVSVNLALDDFHPARNELSLLAKLFGAGGEPPARCQCPWAGTS